VQLSSTYGDQDRQESKHKYEEYDLICKKKNVIQWLKDLLQNLWQLISLKAVHIRKKEDTQQMAEAK